MTVPNRSASRRAAKPYSRMVTIGDATLYQGDAYEILHTLGWFDVLVMDPPYVIDMSGGGKFRADRKHFSEIEEEELDRGFDYSIINALMCGAVVVFCHNNQVPELSTFLNGSFERFTICAWHKSNPMPVANKSYQPDTEFYIHAWNRDFAVAGELADKKRHITTAVGKSDFDHPTVKPDAVMAKIITNVGGRSICDPFMGTGSTGVAAIMAGKRFVGIEKNPKHFATAVERLTAAHAEAERLAAEQEAA
ncbi:DNA-methyltransferase [Sphingobium yanoikuyae]|uniref:DNA-methyltransferase n=1 Tax=Sphingobium yanoikuyae TaxID=13690 RepID=UPI0024330F4E|nr:site-specific DNA-methyltransferase [Sphingobium yanoikuyae]